MFIKRSFHNFQGTFSFCVSSRMAYELTRGAHAQEAEDAQKERGKDKDEKSSRDEEVAMAETKRDERKEEASRDTGEKLAEHLDNVESKKSALKKVAAIIKESPEAIEKAFYNYNLSEHDKPNRHEQAESARIIQKIIDAKKEHRLDGITFIYLGGTNGQRHDLNRLEKIRNSAEQKEWHEKKSEAFKNIIKGKNTIQPVELRAFILTNEDLIKEYQEKVADNKPNKLKIFLATNNSAFCDAAGLFDLALAYQRADDLYGVINEGRRIDPLKDIIILDLKTGAGSEDLQNCRSKLEFTMPEEGKAELVPEPIPPNGEVAPEPTPPKPGPNDLPPETPPAPLEGRAELVPGETPPEGKAELVPEPIPPNGEVAPEPTPPKPGPNDLPPETPPAPLEGRAELVPGAVLLEARHFNDTGINEKIYEKQLKDATEVLKGLDIETKKILTHLTPPVFSFTNSLQPKADSNGRYFVYIDIRNTPQDIKKNLENAAKMIVEEGRFLPNTRREDMAADQAREKGMPFKNIREAYVEDLKNKPKINWNGPAGDPIAPYSWAENDQKDSERFNYAVETPAENADRIRKNDKEKEVKRRSDEEAKKLKDDEDAAKKAAIEEDANKEADPEEMRKFKEVLDAYNVKREAFNATNKLKLVSHLDAFDTGKGPYKLADIDEYTARLEGLSKGIDRFGRIFESMSVNTQNILKSVELVIDQEDEDRKDPGKNISRNTDGSYRLWFDISKDEKTVKKDLIDQKNKFVKGKKYTEDSPIETTQRAKAGAAAFKNLRQAYQEKDEDKKRCITYDAKKDTWEPSKGRKWAGTELYDYSTVEIAAPVETREKDETPKQKQHTIEVKGPGGHQWIVFTRKDGVKKEYQILAYGAGTPYPKVTIPPGKDKNSDYVNIQMGGVSLDVNFRNPPKGDLYAQNQHGDFFKKYHVEVSGNIIKILPQVSKAPAPESGSTPPEAPRPPYKADASDHMKIDGAGIDAKQKIEGKDKRRTFTFNPPITLTADERRVTMTDGKECVALVLKEGEKSVGSIYLDENGKMNVLKTGDGYDIEINNREIAITKKVRRR